MTCMSSCIVQSYIYYPDNQSIIISHPVSAHVTLPLCPIQTQTPQLPPPLIPAQLHPLLPVNHHEQTAELVAHTHLPRLAPPTEITPRTHSLKMQSHGQLYGAFGCPDQFDEFELEMPLGIGELRRQVGWGGCRSCIWGMNMIDERGAKHIANLTNLKKLSFRNNHIGDDGVRFLKKLPNLTWLNLWNNNLGDESAKSLSTMITIEILYLGKNKMTAEGMVWLVWLPRLKGLGLSSNEIDNSAVRWLYRANKLEDLFAGGPLLTQQGKQTLRKALPKCSFTS